MTCPEGHGKLLPLPEEAQSSGMIPAHPRAIKNALVWDGQVISVEAYA
jgi:hypothetical protein